jgi:hypothetical protein
MSIGIYGYQTVPVTVSGVREAFVNGNMADLAAAIASRGMSAKCLRITWNEQCLGTDDEGNSLYQFSDLSVGIIVNADNPGSANSVVSALDFPDWYYNVVANYRILPLESWNAYVLDPCLVGYHWDATNGVCVRDNCPQGYHWDPDVIDCVIDTPTNCPAGTHWDSKLGRAVSNATQNNGQGFPWITVLVGVGVVAAVGVGGYYLYKRSKRRKPPSLPMQNTLLKQ